MKFQHLFFLAILLGSIPLKGQEIYYTREGRISFFSEAPLENIEAHNHRAASVFDAESCQMEFSVLIKGFMFEKSLMQEHFNDNYMETHKYPRATFNGKIVDCERIDLQQEGTYPFKVVGDLEIRGISKSIEAEGAFVVRNGTINGKSTFVVAVADFDIHIPAIVRDNIAREIEIKVDADYRRLER